MVAAALVRSLEAKAIRDNNHRASLKLDKEAASSNKEDVVSVALLLSKTDLDMVRADAALLLSKTVSAKVRALPDVTHLTGTIAVVRISTTETSTDHNPLIQAKTQAKTQPSIRPWIPTISVQSLATLSLQLLLF